MPYLLIFINIFLMATGQILFKQSAFFMNGHENMNLLEKYALNPWFYGAIFFFGCSSLVWVKILTTMKLSIAYPTLSVSYALTALGAFYFFGEKMTSLNIFGMFLIMLGVSIISIK